ncbi:MAG: hypothetical protein OJF49_003686 [Ktedonobacterales bacterium]|nr:MAG: hypothetical protein OJF49_003686 [Ktedonobacterales bacterium]
MSVFHALRGAFTDRARQSPSFNANAPHRSSRDTVTPTPAGGAAALRPRPLAARRIVIEASAMWLATRLAMVALTYFAVTLTPDGRAHGYDTTTLRHLLYTWKQWDAVWYTQIAHIGYTRLYTTAFFPLYPLLIKTVTLVIGEHWLLAAMIVSNLAALGAFIGVGLLAANEFDGANASQRAIRVFAAYPLAFFLTAPYTEGLFIGLVAFSLFFARRGNWRWAALTAFLAALTRPTGIILLPPLVWEFGRQHGWWAAVASLPVWRRLRVAVARYLPGRRGGGAPVGGATQAARGGDEEASAWRSAWRRARASTFERGTLLALALVVIAVPFGIGLYMAYLKLKYGHPLLFLHVQEYFWHRQTVALWESIPQAIQQWLSLPGLSFWQSRGLIDLVPLAVCALVALVSIRRLPFAFTLYMLGLIYLTVRSPIFEPAYPDILSSSGRFMLAAIPVFLILGQWTRRRPGLEMLLISGGFLLQALFAAYFLSGGWLV